MGANEQLQALPVDITSETAQQVFNGGGLDRFFAHIKESVNEVPDLTTAKGRARIASLASQVSRSKTAVEKPGREYLRFLKEQPKRIEADLREFVAKCDALRDEIRLPLTEWEAEQERIEAEKKAAEAAAELARKVESDHEIGLLMNREFDRVAEEARQAAIRAQQERENEIARQAAERARIEFEQKAEAERKAAMQREIDAKLAVERAEREKLEAEAREKSAILRAEQERKDAEERARQAAIQAKADRERAALEAAEAERIRQIREQDALEEEERRRAADAAHKASVNREALDDLKAIGLDEAVAKSVICAIFKKQIRHIEIRY
ncbi:hypothetical protein [Laribacter hongkongensis]|uniref:hypothetical protein n=1 Tax=Laribacter hongkongensis TaxID=168471 RepID=UPI001EFC989B|nr:hypothetical protein [Laribacter hongkongensis]MCG9078481.1 hypothetical protein [Laribacter hongkongensis]